MKKVTFICRKVPQYRIEFYNQLWNFLHKNDIQLQLIFGNEELDDIVNLKWATFVKNRTFNLGQLTLVWQPCLNYIKDSDLVIVEQDNILLLNYLLILKRFFLKRKFAFWGPRANFQAFESSLSSKFKMTYINMSSWWFSYTEGIRQYLIENGVKDTKITVVQNAIDTKTLRSEYLAYNEEDIMNFKIALGLNKGCKVLIYCGELSKNKNITFLLESVIKLKKQTNIKFKLLILGDGPERMAVENFAKNVEDIVFIGPKHGPEKAKYFRIADIFLLPGSIGLDVFDAFVSETPIVTIEYPYHGPEIEYLKNNDNSIIAENDLKNFNANVIRLMEDNELSERLKRQGLETVKNLNIEIMVSNFGKGILECLELGESKNE